MNLLLVTQVLISLSGNPHVTAHCPPDAPPVPVTTTGAVTFTRTDGSADVYFDAAECHVFPARIGPRTDALAAGYMVYALAHESGHVAGDMDEGRVECRATRLYGRAAILLGASRAQARMISGLALAIHRSLPADSVWHLPASWSRALGLDEDDAATVSGEPYDPDPGTTSQPQDQAASAAGASYGDTGGGASPFSPPPVLYPTAKERIAQLHIGAGIVATTATRNEGYAAVCNVFGPQLAQAWVEAAKTDKHARRFVELMETGGAMGGLIFGYGMLALACVYVSGAGEQLGFLFGGFRPYHEAARRREPVPAGAEANGAPGGADPWSADGWLGEDREPPPTDVEAGGARDSNRSDGLRQDAPGA